jgi:hypothetical protein
MLRINFATRHFLNQPRGPPCLCHLKRLPRKPPLYGGELRLRPPPNPQHSNPPHCIYKFSKLPNMKIIHDGNFLICFGYSLLGPPTLPTGPGSPSVPVVPTYVTWLSPRVPSSAYIQQRSIKSAQLNICSAHRSPPHCPVQPTHR